VMLLLALLGMMAVPATAIKPKHSWDTLGNMTFFHSCNESGLFSDTALDTIQKFPFVTIEKGQGFNDGSAPCTATAGSCAEDKITAQIRAIKKRDPSISTVFYMNSVLDWYFYRMHYQYLKNPSEWLRCSHAVGQDGNTTQEVGFGKLNPCNAGGPVRTSGDKHFTPPAAGMLVFDHAQKQDRDFWIDACFRAVASGVIDGCFSDSSNVGTHGIGFYLNASYNAAFEAGKVATMAEATKRFGGAAGKPYSSTSTGTLIGKKSDQQGINAYHIEMFTSSEEWILELMAGVKQGYLVQAHVAVTNLPVSDHGCPEMEDTAAAFLIGAGENCYYGSGTWIVANLADVQMRWCPELFERPLGKPKADAVKSTNGVWKREFASGTVVTFDTNSNKGKIAWAA